MMRLVDRALQAGATRKSALRTEWDVSGNCQKPVERELHVRPSGESRSDDRESRFVREVQKYFPGAVRIDPHVKARLVVDRRITVRRGKQHPLTLAMTLRCRKCDKCLEQRRRQWTARANAESVVAVRNWFGTLTLRPEAHLHYANRARRRLSKQGVDFDALPFGEQFIERHREIGRELTKYVKRVRKETRAQFRFIMVAEHHKSGLPHYHCLVHEHKGSVTHAALSKQWSLGFEKWRLVGPEERAVRYVTKYLAKASVARVRASVRYGYALVAKLSEAKRDQNAPAQAGRRTIPQSLLREVAEGRQTERKHDDLPTRQCLQA